MCIDMCSDMCPDMCIDMCIDICIDMCIDMCIDRHVGIPSKAERVRLADTAPDTPLGEWHCHEKIMIA